MLSLQVGGKKTLLGAIHLPSFSGLKPEDIDEIKEFALKNALIFQEGGFDGVFIQDQTEGEADFYSVAVLSSIIQYVSEKTSINLGTQMECDNGEAILSAAYASGASFVRIKVFVGSMVKSCGIVNGCGPALVNFRKNHNVSTTVLADVFDRCGAPLGNLPFEYFVRSAASNGATGIVLTGSSLENSIEMLDKARKVVPDTPLFCGGGITLENVDDVYDHCDGMIVSSYFKDKATSTWSVDKIRKFTEYVRNK